MENFSEVMELLAQHRWIFDFKLTHFFTDKVWTAAPVEWQLALRNMTCDDLAGIPFGQIKDDWPASLNSFITNSLRYSMPRQQCKSQFVNVNKSDIDTDIIRGMSEKKLHEVCHMTSLVDHVTRLSGSSCVVDVGSGLGYLGQVLHTKYRHNVLGLEGKGSHTSGAERRTVGQSVCHHLQNKTCELYNTKESQENFLILLSGWFSQLPSAGRTCCHMMDTSLRIHDSEHASTHYNSHSNDHQVTEYKYSGMNVNTYEFTTKCQLDSNKSGFTLNQTHGCDRAVGTDIHPPPYQTVDPLRMITPGPISLGSTKDVTSHSEPNCTAKTGNNDKFTVNTGNAECCYSYKNEGESAYRPVCDSSIQYVNKSPRRIPPHVYHSSDCDTDLKSSFSQSQQSVHTDDEFYTNLPQSKIETNFYADSALHSDIPVERKTTMPKVYNSDNICTSSEKNAPGSRVYGSKNNFVNKPTATVGDRTYNKDKLFTKTTSCDTEHKLYTCGEAYTTQAKTGIIVDPAVYEDKPFYTDTIKKETPTKVYTDSSTQLGERKDGQSSAHTDGHEGAVEPKACMVGLHCCGDLTPTMLRYFTVMDSLRSLCCVSCCYHRMSFDDSTNKFTEFPMSKQVSLAYTRVRTLYPEFQFNGYSMRLAAQETRARWRSQTADEHNFHMRNVAYRGLLELCLQQGEFVLEKTSRKLAHKSDHESFDTYIEAVVKHLQMPGAGTLKDQHHIDKFKQVMQSLHEDYRQYFLYIEPITTLQVLLQPVLETLIHTDRQIWLQEHGLQAQLIPIFDDSISPRNVALVAVK